MQELCARHTQTFAPLRITLEPWVNLLRGRAMKSPGILLAYTPANAPAVVVSAGAVPAAGPVGTIVAPGPAVGTVVAPAATAPAVGTVVAPGPAVPTTVAPAPYNSSYPPTAGGVVQGVAQPPPYAVQAEVVAVAPMDRK